MVSFSGAFLLWLSDQAQRSAWQISYNTLSFRTFVNLKSKFYSTFAANKSLPFFEALIFPSLLHMQSVAVSGNVIALYNKIEASAKRQAFERNYWTYYYLFYGKRYCSPPFYFFLINFNPKSWYSTLFSALMHFKPAINQNFGKTFYLSPVIFLSIKIFLYMLFVRKIAIDICIFLL